MNKLIKRIERIAFDMTNFNHFRIQTLLGGC